MVNKRKRARIEVDVPRDVATAALQLARALVDKLELHGCRVLDAIVPQRLQSDRDSCLRLLTHQTVIPYCQRGPWAKLAMFSSLPLFSDSLVLLVYVFMHLREIRNQI